MQRLEVSGEVRPLKWPLGVKWLRWKECTQKIITANIYTQTLLKEKVGGK